MTRRLKPCGTAGGYARHRWRGEDVCGPCQMAWRDYHRDRRAGGYAPPESPRELNPCGTYAAAQRHKAHGEPVCEPCAQAVRDYKAAFARNARAAAKERRAAFETALAEALAEVEGP